MEAPVIAVVFILIQSIIATYIISLGCIFFDFLAIKAFFISCAVATFYIFSESCVIIDLAVFSIFYICIIFLIIAGYNCAIFLKINIVIYRLPALFK